MKPPEPMEEETGEGQAPHKVLRPVKKKKKERTPINGLKCKCFV
jgi:hypothetical protein